MLTTLICLSLATLASCQGDAADPKETNYKKFIGEQEYKLPFKTRVSEPLAVGQTIHAVGTLSEKPTRVDFNFHKGSAKEADLPLHFSIRFNEEKNPSRRDPAVKKAPRHLETRHLETATSRNRDISKPDISKPDISKPDISKPR
uniref:Galectin n=1 Tax=Caenorhabditis japonica TaxID=281687 RepID=A0A8R1IA65_CAEJA